MCHVAVRNRFAGPCSSILYWSGSERSDTPSKRLRVILYVLVTRSNTSLVPPAPESRYWSLLREGPFCVQFFIWTYTVSRIADHFNDHFFVIYHDVTSVRRRRHATSTVGNLDA